MNFVCHSDYYDGLICTLKFAAFGGGLAFGALMLLIGALGYFIGRSAANASSSGATDDDDDRRFDIKGRLPKIR